MRVLLPIALALACTTAVVTASSAPPTATTLTITFWRDSARPAERVAWTLRCSPPAGTLPGPARACRGLAAAGRAAFRPVPKNAACTAVYGGPQKALVRGVVAGARIWTVVTRVDGCEIARWERLRFVLPPGGVP